MCAISVQRAQPRWLRSSDIIRNSLVPGLLASVLDHNDSERRRRRLCRRYSSGRSLQGGSLSHGYAAEKLSQPLPTLPMAHGVVQLILGQVAVRGACGRAGGHAGHGRRGGGWQARSAGSALRSGEPASKVKRSDPDFGMIVNERRRRNGRRTRWAKYDPTSCFLTFVGRWLQFLRLDLTQWVLWRLKEVLYFTKCVSCTYDGCWSPLFITLSSNPTTRFARCGTRTNANGSTGAR